jgi:hypothetical protein
LSLIRSSRDELEGDRDICLRFFLTHHPMEQF